MRHFRDHLLRRSKRSGTAMVEFALVLPLMLIVIFGIVEFARLNMIRNSVENAAYEGARRGILPGATANQAIAEANQVLSIVSVTNAKIVVSPSTIDTTTTQVTVRIDVPLSGAGWLFFFTSPSKVITRSITLAVEQT